EALGFVLGDERVDHLAEAVAGEHFGQLVQGQPDAVVGHPALREVVGPDALGAVAAADHRLPRRGLGPVGLLALLLVDPGAQDLHRLVAVAVLAALVLHGDDDTGGDVGHPNRAVGLVDVLAAGAAGAVDVDAQVLVLDM